MLFLSSSQKGPSPRAQWVLSHGYWRNTISDLSFLFACENRQFVSVVFSCNDMSWIPKYTISSFVAMLTTEGLY